MNVHDIIRQSHHEVISARHIIKETLHIIMNVNDMVISGHVIMREAHHIVIYMYTQSLNNKRT